MLGVFRCSSSSSSSSLKQSATFHPYKGGKNPKVMQFSCFIVEIFPTSKCKNSLMVTQNSWRKLRMNVDDVDDKTVVCIRTWFHVEHI